MHNIDVDGISSGYTKIIDYVFNNGIETSPRGMKTIETSPCLITFNDPRDRIFYDEIRNVNIFFSLAEWLWIVSGNNDVDMLAHYNSKIANYTDDGRTLHGAYGSRLRKLGPVDQFHEIVNKIKKDPDSRQAVMTIYNPLFDFVQTKDVPCTVSFQFLLRNNQLDMITYMRSNDLHLGFPYDFFNFTMIQELIANELEVGLGKYHHFAGSLHIYERSFDLMNKIQSVDRVRSEFASMLIQDIDTLSQLELLIRNNRVNDCLMDNIYNSSKWYMRDIIDLFLNHFHIKNKEHLKMVSSHASPYTMFFNKILTKKSE